MCAAPALTGPCIGPGQGACAAAVRWAGSAAPALAGPCVGPGQGGEQLAALLALPRPRGPGPRRPGRERRPGVRAAAAPLLLTRISCTCVGAGRGRFGRSCAAAGGHGQARGRRRSLHTAPHALTLALPHHSLFGAAATAKHEQEEAAQFALVSALVQVRMCLCACLCACACACALSFHPLSHRHFAVSQKCSCTCERWQPAEASRPTAATGGQQTCCRAPLHAPARPVPVSHLAPAQEAATLRAAVRAALEQVGWEFRRLPPVCWHTNCTPLAVVVDTITAHARTF